MRGIFLSLFCLPLLLAACQESCAAIPADGAYSEPALLRVDLESETAGEIPEDFIGLSYESQWIAPEENGNHYFDSRHKALVRLFKTLGVKSLRLGGNSSDRPRGVRPGPDDVDKLFDFAREAGCRIIYTVQLLNNIDTLAARELAGHIYGQHADVAAYMAIGNEPSYYKDYEHQLRPRWEALQQAISSAAPEARFCGPDDNPNPFINSCLVNDFGAINGQVDKVLAMSSMHYYPGDCAYRNPFKVKDNSELIPCDPFQKRELLLSDDIFSKYQSVWEKMDTVFCRLPFRLTETNSIWYGGLKDASDSYAAALWALDYMYWWACKGARGVNFHTGDRVGGGEGIVAASYSAFVREGRGFDIRPLAYAMKMFGLSAHGQLEPCQLSGNDSQLSTYASSDGNYLWLSLINRQHGAEAGARCIEIAVSGTKSLRWKKARMCLLCQEDNDVAAHEGISIGNANIKSNGRMPAPKWTRNAFSHGHSLMLPPASALVIRIPLN